MREQPKPTQAPSLALVVEVPPALAVLQQPDDLAVAVELVAGLQADAVPAADACRAAWSPARSSSDCPSGPGLSKSAYQFTPIATGVGVAGVVAAVSGILLVVAPVGRRPATQRSDLAIVPPQPSLDGHGSCAAILPAPRRRAAAGVEHLGCSAGVNLRTSSPGRAHGPGRTGSARDMEHEFTVPRACRRSDRGPQEIDPDTGRAPAAGARPRPSERHAASADSLATSPTTEAAPR